MPTAEASIWRRLYYTRLRDAVRGRFDQSLDWRTMVAESGLPADVAATIVEVVRHTRLWRSEKIAVAQELVAHFQDGCDAGQSPQQLIESFGDPMASAQLIRRAKRRGRSYTWQIWTGAWISLLVLLVAYLAIGLCMMASRPSIKVDYLAIANERAAAVPENERAWPHYREALLAMGVVSNSDGVVGDVKFQDARPGDPDWPKVEAFLRDHADAIAKLRAAAENRELGFVTSTSFAAYTPEDQKLFGVSVTQQDIDAYKSQTVENRWLISTLLPDLQGLRNSALLLAADQRRAVEAGDADAAMANTLGLLGISQHCQEMPFLVNTLVAKSVQEITCGVIQDTLTKKPQLWSNGQLQDLAHKFATTIVDWRRGFEGEINGFHDIIQRFYTDNGHGDGRLAFRNSSVDQNIFATLSSLTSSDAAGGATLYSNDGLAMLLLPVANMVVASRQDMTATYERFINHVIVQLGKPLWKQEGLAPPDEECLSDHAGMIDRYRYLFIRILLPAFERLRGNLATLDGERDGVLIGIALELYHREYKSWPKTLDELSPQWLPQVPVDRITGDPLHFKVVDDRALVYSVGVDRDDDGGRKPIDDDDRDHPDPTRASPVHYQPQPVTDSSHDGDWVIWSTAPFEKQLPKSE